MIILNSGNSISDKVINLMIFISNIQQMNFFLPNMLYSLIVIKTLLISIQTQGYSSCNFCECECTAKEDFCSRVQDYI